MLNLLFNESQNYAWVLNYGRRLIEAESKDTKKNCAEHQINTRIYNNAFCGLLRTGYPFDTAVINDQVLVRLMIDGIQFQCPSNTVSNILRQENDIIVRPEVDKYKQGRLKEQEKCEYTEMIAKPAQEPDKKSLQTSFPKDLEDVAPALKITPSKQMKIIRGLKESKELKTEEVSKAFQPHMIMPILDDLMFAPVKHEKIIENDEAEENSAYDEDATEQATEDRRKRTAASEQVKDTVAPEVPSGGLQEEGTEIFEALPVVSTEMPKNTFDLALIAAVATESIADTSVHVAEVNPPSKTDCRIPEYSDIIPKRMFQPKAQRISPKSTFNNPVSKTGSEVPTDLMTPKTKKVFFSTLYSEGEKKKDGTVSVTSATLEATQQDVPVGDESSIVGVDEAAVSNEVLRKPNVPSATIVESEMSSSTETQSASLIKTKIETFIHDGGKVFTHVHTITLKKQFGSSSAGPYRFIFWPLCIVEMQSKKMWADFLVHVTDQNGNEILLCTDGVYKELNVKVDGKEFNVYATWRNGIFESHISPHGKTASIYTIKDEIYKEEPEEAEHDSFLDQFRFERKGQPKHFIVPFKNNNRGELNIPIVGCVELNGKCYPLERRDENTLRYRYHGSDKVIRGHWEKGTFKFSVEDANCFVWEEEHDE